MKKTLLTISLCSSGLFANGQFITPDVVASAGTHFSNTAGQLSYTLGELMIETEIAGSFMLTEGFHQPDLLITAVPAFVPAILPTVYPNPAGDFFNLRIVGGLEVMEMGLYDLQGKRVAQQNISPDVTERVDISPLPAGVYFIRISDAAGRLLHTTKLIRSN